MLSEGFLLVFFALTGLGTNHRFKDLACRQGTHWDQATIISQAVEKVGPESAFG